jgi:purine-nucleoside phosphorylase
LCIHSASKEKQPVRVSTVAKKEWICQSSAAPFYVSLYFRMISLAFLSSVEDNVGRNAVEKSAPKIYSRAGETKAQSQTLFRICDTISNE